MRRVLILGGDSDYNLGDAAILAALCACFAKAGAAEIIVTSALTQPRLPPGATGVLMRGLRAIPALMRAASGADLVVIGGGGLFQDDDSRVKMPYWASRTAALRLVNANIVGHSVGAGPLEHAESRIAARVTCNALRSVTVRDPFAQAALQRCTALPIQIVPDPAFMLEPAPTAQATDYLASLGIQAGRPVIGICLRKWFHARGGFIPSRVRMALGITDTSGTDSLKQLLEQLASALLPIANAMDASILLLPTYSAVYENDAQTCEAFGRLLPGRKVNIARITDPALYKAVTGRLSVLVSSRMHPLILAAGMGTPIVGLAYNGKFEGMFDMLQSPHQMLWLDDAINTLPMRMSNLIDQAMRSGDTLRQNATQLAATVSARTIDLLGTASPPSAS